MLKKREEYKLLDQTVLGRAVFEPPFKVSSAMHDEARFVYVINGTSKLYAPKNQFDLSPGDCLIMKCENFVNNWFKNEDGADNEIIVIHFYPDLLKFIYNDQLPDFFSTKNPTKAKPVETVQPSKMLDNFVESLRFYLDHPHSISDELVKIKVQELILILTSTDGTGRIKAILSELFHTTEYEFKEIVYTNLYEDLSVEDLAFFAGLSLSSFKRKFKSIFGTSPRQFIIGKRLEKAQNLLETTDQRISEIAYDCGFNDIGYFSKSFHSAFDISPSEYRKQLLT